MKLKRFLLLLVTTFCLLSVSTPAKAEMMNEDVSLSEKIDKGFAKGVDFLAGIFFWDPFEAIGIYNPVVYDDGKPFIETQVDGLVKATAGSDTITGVATVFTRSLNGVKYVVFGGKDHKISEVIDDTHFVISDELEEDVLASPIGLPKTQGIPFIVVWLIAGAVFFTLRFKLINFRGLPHTVGLLRGDYDDPNDKGEVSHFQALATALSGTVGLGNIASVAIAVSIGGPGATFWMIMAGFLGTATKFIECTLGVKYRKINEKGEVSGGPMYYLRDGLAANGYPKLGRFLAASFAIMCVGACLGGGNMFQSNQAIAQLGVIFPATIGHEFLVGIIMAVCVGAVIIGGVKSIARVTGKIVPFMAGVYLLSALVVILVNYDNIIPSFKLIFEGAFNASAMKGGFIGVLLVGFKRAAFSNEAGIGSSSIAHSAAKTNEPVSEGLVALVEPIIDTVVICTMTALVIVITGAYQNPDGLEGAQLTSQAFGSVIDWFPYLLSLAIFLFAFSTIISWSYYGVKAWTYLFGYSKWTSITFKVIFLLALVVGGVSSMGAVIDFTDMMILAMALPNIIGLILMSGEISDDLKSYLARVKSGEIKKFK